jgi:tetratricopeptide (TPR) repeat protein
MPRTRLVVLLALCLSSSLSAQRLGPPEKRPQLRSATDTNDAHAYYNEGLSIFSRDPETASAHFYWAARIDPAWSDAIYARRAALIMRDAGVVRQYFERSFKDRRSDEMLKIDSLQFRALMLNPFLFRRLDRQMFTTYLRNDILRQARRGGGTDPSPIEIDHYIDQWLLDSGPGTRAWLAYADGNFSLALENYARSLGSARNKASVHVERARVFGMTGQVDSAVAEFDLALVDLRKKDQKDLVVFYDSKAQAEFSKAVLLEGAGNPAGAREAYSQALQEDLAYYPAHLRLGMLALGSKDTTTAMSELALAAQLAGDEPQVRYLNGYVLAASLHLEEAAAELQKAVQLEPYYALPYLRLGQVYENLGKGPEALAAYESFIARASQTDVQREYAVSRITEVKEIMGLAKP